MRVLLDCRMASWSGIGRYSTGLARSLARMDGVEIVQVVEEGGTPPVADAESIPARKHAFYPTGGFELGAIVRRVKPDLTHCLHVPTPIPVRHPLVVTIHDLTPIVVPAVMPSEIRRAAYRFWNFRASGEADRILANSNATKCDILRYYPHAAGIVSVVPHAADDFALVEAAPVPAEIAGDGSPYLLSMGNTKPNKDLPTLLRAFAKLRAAHPGLRLLLVGREVPGYAASVLGDGEAAAAVSFTGHVTDGVLRSLYSGAAAFVFPSRYEGFGLPPLEAMISGTPVVCSDAASLPEVVGDAALLFPAGDAAAAAAQVERVLGDSALRASLVAAGTTRAARFTWERTAAGTLSAYREVLEHQHR
jgi:glycosyltransferase involved in cell wall biosynthesis